MILHLRIYTRVKYIFNNFKFKLTSGNGSAVTYKHNNEVIFCNFAMQAVKCKTTVQSFPPLKLTKTSSGLYL